MEAHDKNSAVVTLNNQNSVLLTMYLRIPGVLCLLHDNRIFGFKKENKPTTSNKKHDEGSREAEQNLMLSLLTTAKFRMMGFLYSGYHLVDNTLFLLIIIISIMNNKFKLPEHHDIALFAAIGLEGFYDFMLYTHRYWILQRLSIYIGIVLYVIYFVIVGIISSGAVTNPDIPISVVWWVLGVRFAAFVLEELVDIAIDIQLHNDLVKLNQERIARLQPEDANGKETVNAPDEPAILPDHLALNIEQGQSSTNTSGNDLDILLHIPKKKEGYGNQLKRYVNVSYAVQMPKEIEYIGSVFAWGQRSVFDSNAWTVEKFSSAWSICLCFFPAIPAFLVFIPILILCCTAGLFILLFVIIVAIFTGNCNVKRYFVELLHI